LFSSDRSVVAFLPAITEIHAAGAKAAKGLLLAKSITGITTSKRSRLQADSFRSPARCPMPPTLQPASRCGIIYAPSF
jgi:hypothetical protein